MNIKEKIRSYSDDIKRDLSKLIKYNSVLDTSDSNYPFGKVNAECLDEALGIMKDAGLTVNNLDYYSGYGEIGSGEKLIGILGHLDVVPAGTGWSTDPFELTQKDDILYGRGVSDDKGPVIAGLYAIKLLMETKKDINKRIRLIVGSNEESGSKCLDYYVKKEGHIDYGFTPDGSFPGVHGEKGFVSGLASAKTSKIKSISGGVAKNVVLTHLDITLEKDSFDLTILKDYLETNGLKLTSEVSDVVSLKVEGVSAHASLPELGKNALSYTMVGLKKAGINDEFVDYYNNVVGLSYDGSSAGINCNDQYGPLTFNIGLVHQENDEIFFSIDIRYPVTLHHDPIINKMEDTFNKGGKLVEVEGAKPLFYEPDSPMIEALVKAYAKVTNDYESKPEVIGGGTYSKGINNCIAFGGAFKNMDYHIHDKDELLPLEELYLQIEIYYEALLNLLEIK